MHVFGYKSYHLLKPYNKHKLEYRSKPCIFLGYLYAGYKCLDPTTNKVYLSRHVIFDESSFPAKEKAATTMPPKLLTHNEPSLMIPVSFPSPHIAVISSATNSASISTTENNPQPTKSLTFSSSPVSHDVSSSSHDNSGSPPPIEFNSAATQDTLLAKLNYAAPVSADFNSAAHTESSPSTAIVPSPLALSHPMTTQSQTGSLKPKSFPDYKMFSSSKYPLTVMHTILREIEPSSYRKAATNPQWQEAMQQGFDALLSNHTWSLCPRPTSHNVIHNKWVYKIKQMPDGSIERFKALLVAKGFEQLNGIDYTETFNPVIKPSTIRIVLALAVQFDWSIGQLEVSNAFYMDIWQRCLYGATVWFY